MFATVFIESPPVLEDRRFGPRRSGVFPDPYQEFAAIPFKVSLVD
jgi:hypothetical protein